MSMNCPRCIDVKLIDRLAESESGVYRCGNCSGNWMDYASVESHLVASDKMAASACRSIWDLKTEISPILRCPLCQSGLHFFVYRGVELDYCMQCRGLWFDALEMENFLKRYNSELFKSGVTKGHNHSSSTVPLGIIAEVLFGAIGAILCEL